MTELCNNNMAALQKTAAQHRADAAVAATLKQTGDTLLQEVGRVQIVQDGRWL